MSEQQIQQLVEKLAELERTYIENGFPLTALKIAGSRVDDARCLTDRESITELVRKADRALEQAENVAKLYLEEKIVETWGITHEMQMELYRDHPHHYSIQD